jgi:hypothetical protein
MVTTCIAGLSTRLRAWPDLLAGRAGTLNPQAFPNAMVNAVERNRRGGGKSPGPQGSERRPDVRMHDFEAVGDAPQ